MDDKDKLLAKLKLDMKHWSVDALKDFLQLVDDRCLSDNGNGWWWKLRRSLYAELISRENSHEH